MHSASDAPLEERNRPAKPQQAAPNVADVNRAPAPNPKFISPPPPEPHLVRAYAMIMSGVNRDPPTLPVPYIPFNNCGWDNAQPAPSLCIGPLQNPGTTVNPGLYYDLGQGRWHLTFYINELDCEALTCNSLDLYYGQTYSGFETNFGLDNHYSLTVNCGTLPVSLDFKLNSYLIHHVTADPGSNDPPNWNFIFYYYFVNCCGFATPVGFINS